MTDLTELQAVVDTFAVSETAAQTSAAAFAASVIAAVPAASGPLQELVDAIGALTPGEITQEQLDALAVCAASSVRALT